MDSLFVYPVMAVFVLGLNIIPAFMPPTWVVLAFFFHHYDLSFFPTVVLGAIAATSGRIILYTLSRLYFKRLFPKKYTENYEALGGYLQNHQSLTIPIVLTYAFLPIPSNQVFIIAGLAKLRIKIIALSFVVGRLISYTFWILLTGVAVDRLEGLFSHHMSRAGSILVDIIGVLIIIGIGRINWKKILRKS